MIDQTMCKKIAIALIVSLLSINVAAYAADTKTAYDARDREDDTHGRFAFGHLSVIDSSNSAARDISVSHLYYRYIDESVFGNDHIKLNLDGRFRNSSGSSDWNNDIPTNRLQLANIELSKLWGAFDIALGRSYIEEFVSQSVDGVNAKFWLNKVTGVGLFTGFRPDPFDDTLNSDYTTYGGYAFSRTDIFGASAGYAIDNFKGDKDRERANVALFFMPAAQKWHMQANIDFDNDFDSHEEEEEAHAGWHITNMMLHGNFRPSEKLLLNFTYNEFIAIIREASLEEIVGEGILSEDKYSIGRVKLEVRPWKTFGIYGGIDIRNREIDGKSATQFYAGMRSYNFFGGRWDISYANLDWFTAKINVLKASIGASKDRFDGEIAFTYLTNSQEDFDNDMNQMIVDFYGSVWISKHLYATASVSWSQEEFLDIDSAFNSRFDSSFSTTTVYGQIGYRF